MQRRLTSDWADISPLLRGEAGPFVKGLPISVGVVDTSTFGLGVGIVTCSGECVDSFGFFAGEGCDVA